MNKLLFTALIMIISSITVFAAEKQNPCKGKDIEWLKKHIPVPRSVIASKKNVNGMCEIILNAKNKMLSIYATNEFIVTGKMYKDKVRVTDATLNILKKDITKNNIGGLKNATAFTYTPENPSGKVLYMLTDPLCPYCSKAAKEIKDVADETGVTIKTVLYTVHDEDGEKKCKKAICNNMSFEEYINTDWNTEKTDDISCDKADKLLEKAEEIASKLGVPSVPAFIFEDGQRVAGTNIDKIAAILKQDSSLAASNHQ